MMSQSEPHEVTNSAANTPGAIPEDAFVMPMSFAQQRLWFLEQFEPDGRAIYHIPLAFHLTGQLDVSAFLRSLQAIVQRHESLRTTFAVVQHEPRQIILPAVTLEFPCIDLTHLPATDRMTEALRLVHAEARRPFAIEHGPLLRAILFRLAAETHVVLITVHHIIFDGWSMGILSRELSTLYAASSTVQSSSLPALPIQYADFALRQRQWLQGEVLAERLAYWTSKLQASPPLLALPTDRPRPAVQTFHGACQPVRLSATLTQALKTVSQQAHVTLFMTLLAAFKTLLARYTSCEDIIVGTPIANRTWAELEPLIGFFANTLALRTNLSGNPRFRELLQRVRTTTLEAYTHQELPFEKLIEELQPERHLSYPPLVQVLLAFQNTPRFSLMLTGLTVQPLDIMTDTAKFDLSLSLWEEAGELHGDLNYNTDLFDATTITRLLGHFQILLEGIVADPDRRVADLPLLSSPERHQLLVEWNVTQATSLKDTCIHQLFEAQVARTPDAIALVHEAQQLSYQALNSRANQLAHALLKSGIRPHRLVGLCVERSIEAVIGMLAILKAGGAYVPLDPTWPAARLDFMLHETEISVLLTQTHLQAKLPMHHATVVCLDTVNTELTNTRTDNPNLALSADHLAYVMYTSGSTGQPKGVSIPHRGVVRLVHQTNYVTLNTSETLLQFAPLTFDASTFEIWGSLLNGARLVMLPPYTPSLDELGHALRYHHITTLWLPAGLFRQMVDSHLDSFRGVRQLLTGGDVVSMPHAQQVLEALPTCRLINGYGPTENTTFTCCHPMTFPERVGATVPLGRPITDTQVYVLDTNRQLLPIGIPGELYIGGDGLAHGYYKRADLTAERFIPHPFSDTPGARLYKSGDLVRWRPDGTLEFLGRLDNQVKVRGFRVEPGEIETVLGQHPSVRETVVVAREDTPGEKRLVAYLVTSAASPPSPSELRRFIQSQLPEYMVPSAFVVLDAFPLTPNGKLDRQALPAPDTLRPALDNAFVAPHTSIEEQLVAIWQEILRIDHVGIHDNFFTLGGHSLLATQILSRIRRTFAVQLPLRRLFETPTIAGLAETLEQLTPNDAAQESPVITPVAREAYRSTRSTGTMPAHRPEKDN